MLSFLKQRILGMDSELFNHEGVYNFLAAILNTLQAVNFSFNFLLYCAVNLSFRGLFVDMVRCRGVASSQQNGVVLQRMQLINDASINQAPEVLVNLSSSLPEEEVAWRNTLLTSNLFWRMIQARRLASSKQTWITRELIWIT